MEIANVTAGADTFTSNAYLTLGTQTALVDAGAMAGVEEVVSELTDSLERVVLTHQHPDHVEELDAIVDAFDPEVYAFDAHPAVTREVEAGEELVLGDDSFEVVHTPGHAADHISLVSETTLYSGDVVVYADGAFEDGSFGRTDRPGQSRERLIDSIQRLLECVSGGEQSLYAGHGPEYHGDVRAVLERALERAERREPKYD